MAALYKLSMHQKSEVEYSQKANKSKQNSKDLP